MGMAAFYSNPLIQSMNEPMQRRLMMLQCLSFDYPLDALTDDELAAGLRISKKQWLKTKSLFVEKGLFDANMQPVLLEPLLPAPQWAGNDDETEAGNDKKTGSPLEVGDWHGNRKWVSAADKQRAYRLRKAGVTENAASVTEKSKSVTENAEKSVTRYENSVTPSRAREYISNNIISINTNNTVNTLNALKENNLNKNNNLNVDMKGGVGENSAPQAENSVTQRGECNENSVTRNENLSEKNQKTLEKFSKEFSFLLPENLNPAPESAPPETGKKAKRAEKTKRGHRLPDDWQPSEELARWAAAARPDLDTLAETENFRDYWHAESGANASKLDWSAAFRRWIRTTRAHFSHASNKPTTAPKIDKPDNVDNQVWQDYLLLRERKNAPLTLTALQAIQDEAQKANIPLNDALKIAIQRGWTGISAEWLIQNDPDNGVKRAVQMQIEKEKLLEAEREKANHWKRLHGL